MHWLDIIKVRDLMRSEVVTHATDGEHETLAAQHSATEANWVNTGVVHLGPDASLREACQLMTEQDIDRVPVMQNERRIGLLSTMDVVRYLASGAGY